MQGWPDFPLLPTACYMTLTAPEPRSWSAEPVGSQPTASALRSHTAHFYSSDSLLTAEISQRLGVTFASGGGGILVATPAHLAAFAQQLQECGFDLERIHAQGRWLALDAADTLDQFMTAGWPDRRRFFAVMQPLIDRVISTLPPSNPQLTIFGEMVALLWEQGKSAAALRLEELWNELALTRQFHLYCGWPLRFFRESDAAAIRKICAEHTHVLPAPAAQPSFRETHRPGGVLWQLKAQALLQSVSHITRQTLGFYRDTSSSRWVSVPETIDEVLAIYDRRFRYKEVSLRKNIRPDLKICTPIGEFKQILSNLLSNAADASSQGDSVWISAWPSHHPVTQAPGIRLAVADQGVGIPASISRTVFTPLFTTTKDINIGLGLWVVRDLIEKRGGFIRCRSRVATPEMPGSGTVMMAFLPANAGTASRNEAA